MSEKKREPQAGDTVPYLSNEWRLIERGRLYAAEGWTCELVKCGTHGSLLVGSRSFMSDDGFARGSFVATPAPLSVEGTRDWSAWLPKARLPDTGPKVFKVGQVWAGHNGHVREVYRVTRVTTGGHVGATDPLAGDEHQFFPSIDSLNARCSVLVAEPGCPPTDPATLYTPTPTSKPVAEKPPRIAGCCTLHGGGFYSVDGKCPKCATPVEEKREPVRYPPQDEHVWRNREGVLWQFTGEPSPHDATAWQCWKVQGEAAQEGMYWPPHFIDGTLTFVSERETADMDMETGRGIAALSLPPPRQPYVCQVSDWDLLEDVDVRR